MGTRHKKLFLKFELVSPQTLSVASVKHIRDGQQFADLVMFAPFRLFKSKKVTFLFTTKTALGPLASSC